MKQLNARVEVCPGSIPAQLGESPWWDGLELSWVDIRGCAVHHLGWNAGSAQTFEAPAQPGFAIPTRSGGWVLGLRDGVWGYDGNGWARHWQASHDAATHRLNDAKTDATGRLWLGSMTDEEREPTSSLYAYNPAEGARSILDGIITSNGLGWSPDNTVFYYTDSIRRTIWRFACDLEQGRIWDRQVFAEDPQTWVPDGLSVDNDGFVWSCKWDGGRIVRYAPDGRVDAVFLMPVARPTSCTFAGPDRRTLAITSARGAQATHELDGQVLLMSTASSGPLLEPFNDEGWNDHE